MALAVRLQVFLTLLGLRYRLLWAQVRLRQGKVAVFAVAYLLVCLAGAALLLGGFGAATAAIRLGKAELLARAALAGSSSMAAIAALVLGIGVTPAFSAEVLRRYPVSAGEAYLTRRVTAFLEPVWMALAALVLGMAAGFHAMGAGSLWLGAPAALLLVVCTYLAAQLAADLIAWVTARPWGLAVLVVLTLAAFVAASAGPAIGGPRAVAALLPALRATPAFLAAGAMTGGPATTLVWLATWCAALAAAIAAAERLPRARRSAAGAAAEWDGFPDRIAAHFGEAGPLVAKTLKYYWRTKRGRLGFLLNVPTIPFMLVMMRPDRNAPLLHFSIGLGVMAIVGFAATFSMAVNSFGFDGAGFRRYFLLPIPPEEVVRSSSLLPLLIGILPLPPAFAVCVLLARTPVDARMAIMLASNGVGGLCFFQGLALWTSILAPSRTDGGVRFGNDLSLPANLVANVGLLGALFGSQALGMLAGARILDFWWIAPAFAAASVMFYAVSYRLAPGILVARRERILAVVEREQGSGRLVT